MKQLLVFLFAMISLQAAAQTYPITSINISLPSNPDRIFDRWGSSLTISSTTRMVNGKVDERVRDSRILVIIKKNGSKFCGSFNNTSAPSSNFNSPTKIWNGSNAISLLGVDCVMPPGNYELSVQFFGDGPAGPISLSEEKSKTFTIRGSEQQSYQSPRLIAPTNSLAISSSDIKKPIIFRWTPVVPKPQEPVTYRLKVWQLMQGQTGTQAIKTNQPIITKDVDNITQTAITLINNSESESAEINYVWTVQALNKEGKGIGNNDGISELNSFSVNNCSFNLSMRIISTECVKTEAGVQYYRICLSTNYSSNSQNLTFNNSGSGFKAYSLSYGSTYTITNITPSLQSQNIGSSIITYCLEIKVPTGQSDIIIGLQGDNTSTGPITCQPGSELKVKLPNCPPPCDCGTWGDLIVQMGLNPTGINRPMHVACGKEMDWKCNQDFKFSNTYQCKPNDKTCTAKTSWSVTKDGQPFANGAGSMGSFKPIANGVYKITLNASCNGKECLPCTYTIIVKDCLPPCDCGTWGDLIVQNAVVIDHVPLGKKEMVRDPKGTIRVSCGKEMDWKCNQDFKFSNTYQCKPNDKTCTAKTSWSVTKDGQPFANGAGSMGSFKPTANGVYTITLNASCNGKECPPCTYMIIVKDCLPPCDCGTWGDLIVQNAVVIDHVPLGKKEMIRDPKGTIRVSCGKEMDWKCNQDFRFSNTYQCKPNDKTCTAKTSWSVTKDGQPFANGAGSMGSFKPTANGVYTITLNASCNGKECLPCTYTIIVKDCLTCDCGTWGDLVVQMGLNPTGINRPIRVSCGKEMDWKCNQDFRFSNTYQCKPNDKTCTAKTSWSVTKDGQPFANGAGSMGSFKPIANGVYKITLNASCNGKECLPCTYTIIVKDCPPTCDCGTWGNLFVNRAKYECGNEKPIKWTCIKPINFSNTYQCTPNDKTCQAKTKWEVTKDGQSFSSGSGSIGTFTPTSNGTYTLTLYANCDGKECKPCVTTFIVEDCKPVRCIISAPDTVCIDSKNNLTINNIVANNFSGTGNYSWQLVSDPFNPTSCPGRTGSFGNSLGSIIISNFNITTPCTYKLTVSRGGCTAERYITVIRCTPEKNSCVLDPGMTNAGNSFARRITLAQTFTPTQNGFLNKITHGLQSISGVTNYDLLVTTTTGGLPSWTGGTYNGSNVLYKVTGLTIFSNSAMVNAVVTIPSGQEPYLIAGIQYALILIPGTPTTGDMIWRGNTNASSYLNGSAYELVGTIWVIPTIGPKDHGFKLDGLCQ